MPCPRRQPVGRRQRMFPLRGRAQPLRPLAVLTRLADCASAERDASSDEFRARRASEPATGSQEATSMADDTVSAATIINAPAEAIFAVLADPARARRDRRHRLGPRIP